MLAIRAVLSASLICIFTSAIQGAAEHTQVSSNANEELATCEDQLSKYRRFILQALISFEDVCEAYSSHNQAFLLPQERASPLYRTHEASEQYSESLAFLKLLMAQFNDSSFLNVLRDRIIQRCRVKSQLQRDEKRNSVILGKKQRFHSWGGKRSSESIFSSPAAAAGPAYTEDNNGAYFL